MDIKVGNKFSVKGVSPFAGIIIGCLALALIPMWFVFTSWVVTILINWILTYFSIKKITIWIVMTARILVWAVKSMF